jgi:hypothetical protein
VSELVSDKFRVFQPYEPLFYFRSIATSYPPTSRSSSASSSLHLALIPVNIMIQVNLTSDAPHHVDPAQQDKTTFLPFATPTNAAGEMSGAELPNWGEYVFQGSW